MRELIYKKEKWQTLKGSLTKKRGVNMSKMGTFQPTEKYKNYSQPNSKPFKSHSFYTEKVWTLQEQINKKLKKIAEFIESLYPKLTDDFRGNIQIVIEKNVETLVKDLDLLQTELHNNPSTFNTSKLKTNQHYINEMKHACDTLQTISSYEHEFKKLGKIKHALTELEHLIQPTSFEKSLKTAQVKSKPKAAPAKKEHILVQTQKKIKEKSVANSKNQKTISKKAKLTTKLLKPIKTDNKKLQKSKVSAPKLKQAAKKVAKPKAKLPSEPKKALTAKSKTKIKSSAANKKI
jgi:hypothetical protein